MSIVSNIFCPECDSVLDISRISGKKTYDLDNTPSSMSDQDEDKIGKIINKLVNNENVDNLIENIKMEQIVSHEMFQKMDKNKKNSISEKIENIFSKIDVSSQAYYICKTCSWSQKIKPGTQILSKIGGGSQTSYLNMDRFKNKIYSKTLPFTRNYICPNKECSGNKDHTKHEAVFFRVNDNMHTLYACCACQSIWNAQ
jgi:hypothetical protein